MNDVLNLDFILKYSQSIMFGFVNYQSDSVIIQSRHDENMIGVVFPFEYRLILLCDMPKDKIMSWMTKMNCSDDSDNVDGSNFTTYQFNYGCKEIFLSEEFL